MHPFAQWLLTNAAVLAHNFPAPFQRVFRRAGGVPGSTVEEINKAMGRVARSRPDIAPPAAAYLRQDKEDRWWSR